MTVADAPRFDAVLDINDPEFANKLADAIGLEPGEKLEIRTPQFERADGLSVPLPMFDFAKLPNLTEGTLKAIGCQKWDEPDERGEVLWLYPAEWYVEDGRFAPLPRSTTGGAK